MNSNKYTLNKPALPPHLRKWQSECLAAQQAHIQNGEREFFTGAGVGSGKTIHALLAFIAASDFQHFVAITSKSGIRASWVDDAALLGLTCVVVSQFEDLLVPAHGYVFNVQLLGNPDIAAALNDLCATSKVLACLDEAHHYHDGNTWGMQIAGALGGAAFTVAMSGTPYRESAYEHIMCLPYVKNDAAGVTEGAPHFNYNYANAVQNGDVAALTTRFISGRITQEAVHDETGKSYTDVYDFADGDYTDIEGEPSAVMMDRRLALATVVSFGWQWDAFLMARRELVAQREDGNPWAGIVFCYNQAQCDKLADEIERRFPRDGVARIYGNVETEAAVAEFNNDTSKMWLVCITKVSEGVSCKRLRTGLSLTMVKTKAHFEQCRGRLVRVFDGVHPLLQTPTFFVAADPRLMEFALSSNEIVAHTVKWLKPAAPVIGTTDGIDDDVVDICIEQTADSQTQLDGTTVDSELTGEQRQQIEGAIAKLRGSVTASAEALTEPPTRGSYTYTVTEAKAMLDGAAIDDNFYDETEYVSGKQEFDGIVHPLVLARLNGAGVQVLQGVRDTDLTARVYATAAKKLDTGVSEGAIATAVGQVFVAVRGADAEDLHLKNRDWSLTSDEVLIADARAHAGPRACKKAASRLYTAVLKRNLSSVVWPDKQQKRARGELLQATDEALIAEAREHAGPRACKQADRGLYKEALKRKLSLVVWPDQQQQRAPGELLQVSDEALIADARAHDGPTACQKADRRLYKAVLKRTLSKVVWPNSKTRKTPTPRHK